MDALFEKRVPPAIASSFRQSSADLSRCATVVSARTPFRRLRLFQQPAEAYASGCSDRSRPPAPAPRLAPRASFVVGHITKAGFSTGRACSGERGERELGGLHGTGNHGVAPDR